MSDIQFPINVDREMDLSRELARKPLAGLSILDYDEFAASKDWSWGDDTRYGFATGLVRAIEHRLIAPGRFLRLAEARDEQEALSMLGDTDYARIYQEQLYATNGSEESGPDVELLLGREAGRVKDFINGLTQDREVTDILFVRDDFLNLKLALKGIVAGVEVGEFLRPPRAYRRRRDLSRGHWSRIGPKGSHRTSRARRSWRRAHTPTPKTPPRSTGSSMG